MRALKRIRVPKSSVTLDANVTREQVMAAERFLDEGGSVAKVFEESLAAGGVLREDIIKVHAAAMGLLTAGLTERALVVLIQDLAPKQRNGRPIPDYIITNVLDALRRLDEFIQKAKP